MPRIEEILAPRIIAEIGDISTNRSITKRESSLLGKQAMKL